MAELMVHQVYATHQHGCRLVRAYGGRGFVESLKDVRKAAASSDSR